MSDADENLALVRSIFVSWESGEYRRTEWAHPEIEFVFADGPTPGSWTGLGGLAAAWGDFLSVWEDFRSELDGHIELDGERVLALARYSGRGKTSRIDIGEMPARSAGLFSFRDGKVSKLVFYFDRERALAQLGLTLEPGSAH